MLPDIRQSNYRELRDNCNFPEDVALKTKPQLTTEMLTNIAKQKHIPFRYALADSVISFRTHLPVSDCQP